MAAHVQATREWEDVEAAEVTFDVEPESPFLPEPSYRDRRGVAETARPLAEAFDGGLDSPFLSEYTLAGVSAETPEAELYREVLAEIFDDDFAASLTDLAREIADTYEDRLAGEFSQPIVQRAQLEIALEEFIGPLQVESEALFERMAQGIEGLDLESMPEAELEELLDRFEPGAVFGNPAMDMVHFGLFKKIKKAVKAGIKRAKRIAKTVKRAAGKISPTAMLLRRLKKIVRPLLRRVLRFAINKLPRRFQPVARNLARRFLGEVREEEAPLDAFEALGEPDLVAEALFDAESAAPVPEILEAEFDAMVVGYILEGEAFDSDSTLAEYLRESEEPDDAIGDLEQARETFAREIVSIAEGEDPTPHVEQYVAAVLMALRVGIQILGRRRVVDFLAKLVARLIGRYVGQQAAPALSRALVDAGLSYLSLEVPEDDARIAGEVLAATVEETIERLVLETPVEVFEEEAVLTAYVQEAFEAAAAANFPPELVKPELREAPESMGAWVLMPRGRRRKRYKKYTRTIDVVITPKMAERIVSFGGQTLKSFLGEQLGLPVDKQEVKGRIHLFEAIRGSTLSLISLHERSTPGLGSHRRHAWMQIHPLTCEAAGLLMPKEVGLCRNVPERFLADRNLIRVGQRFYFLEVPGARMRTAPPASPLRRAAPAAPVTRGPTGRPVTVTQPARPSQVNVTLDFRARRVVVYDFLSEAASQDVASRLRRRAGASAVVGGMRGSLQAGLNSALSGPGRHLRVVREVPAEQLAPVAGAALRWVGRQLAAILFKWLVAKLTQYLSQRLHEFGREFAAAAEAPADGVTVIVTAEVGAFFDVLALASPMTAFKALRRLQRRGLSGTLSSVGVRPGLHR